MVTTFWITIAQSTVSRRDGETEPRREAETETDIQQFRAGNLRPQNRAPDPPPLKVSRSFWEASYVH